MLLGLSALCQLCWLAGREHGRTIPLAVIGRIEIPQRSTPSRPLWREEVVQTLQLRDNKWRQVKMDILGKDPSGRFLELAHRADSRCECSRHIRPDFGAGLTAIRSYQIKNVGGAV